MRFPSQITAVALTLSLMCASAQAQELYFRNKPFKGPRVGSWEQVMVGLKEAAEAFELPISEENGAYLVGEVSETAATPGQVVVNGKLVSSQPGETGPLVNLKELAAAAELSYKPNKDLGGIDVTKPVAKGGKSSTGVFYTEGEPNYISRDNPGADPEVDKKAVRGKITLMYLYAASYKDAAYQSTIKSVDQLAQIEGVVLFKFPKGPSTTPLHSKYRSTSPTLYVFDKRAHLRAQFSGHSISIEGAKAKINNLKREP